MNHPNHYESKLDIISAIPAEKISAPVNIPVPVYIHEAGFLYHWCQADKEKLTANGLDWSIVEDLPARIDTLREAQGRWAASSGDIVLMARWKEITAETAELRLVLIRSLRFIFSNDPAVLALIQKFSKGRSHAAVIQSLNDILIFSEKHADRINTAGIDITQFRRAAELSREMASLHADINCAKNSPDKNLTLRNQAFTYLEEAVEEIKFHAKYVLWRDPTRLKGYSSEYISRKNRRYKQNRLAKELTSETTEQSCTIDHSAEAFKPYPEALIVKTDTPELNTDNLKPETGASGRKTNTTKLKTKAPEAKTNKPGRETIALECHTDDKNNYTGTPKRHTKIKIKFTGIPGMQTDRRIH